LRLWPLCIRTAAFLQEAVDKKRKDDGIRGTASGNPKSQRGFPQKKLPWCCAFCTENRPEEKTEEIKKENLRFFEKTLAKCTKM
jgi:hypothetical protein